MVNSTGVPITMSALEVSKETAAAHAPLVQRAAGIFTALGGTGPNGAPIRLADAAENGAARALALARAARPELIRRGSAVTLAYVDGGSEATLAALLAGATPAGLPIAADTESLSVLALAERLAASDLSSWR